MALMIFSARSQVDPLPCLECSPACELPHSCRESKDDQILIISNPYCKCSFNWFILYTHVWGKTGNIKTSPFIISLCILRDLPQQKIPRELCGGGRSCNISMFPCPHGKIFWWDESGKFKNTRRKECRKEKEEIFYTHGGSHTHVFSIGREHPRATTLMQPSLRRTHSNWNLPYNLLTSNQLAAAAPSVGWVSCPDQYLASYFIILITTW